MKTEEAVARTDPVDGIRRVARGFHAAHVLASQHLATRAKAARYDDSSTDLIRSSLFLQSEAEGRVAAEFGTVADLLDRAASDRQARA